MNFLKNNIRTIIGFIVGVIIASGITVYAYSFIASDISYTKPGTETAISVEEALNDLYRINTENIECNSGTFNSSLGENSINVGFLPSKIVFTKQSGVTCVYNSKISNTNVYTCNSTGVHTYVLNSNNSDYNAKIISIGEITNFYASSNNESWYWFAIK